MEMTACHMSYGLDLGWGGPIGDSMGGIYMKR